MSKKNLAPSLGRLAYPPPDGVSRDTVECDLKQVETQLKLVKSLIDAFPAFEDAVKVQHIIHNKLIDDLSRLADASIAEWASNEEKKESWLNSAAASKPKEDLKSAVHTSCRWTREEVALFDQALKDIDFRTRGATKQIAQRIPTKTIIQVRDRLRRLKTDQKRSEGDHHSEA